MGTPWRYPNHPLTHICKFENAVFWAVLPFKSRLDRDAAEALLPEGLPASRARIRFQIFYGLILHFTLSDILRARRSWRPLTCSQMSTEFHRRSVRVQIEAAIHRQILCDTTTVSDEDFDHFDSGDAFSPLPGSMVIAAMPPVSMLPPMPSMLEHGSRSVPATLKRPHPRPQTVAKHGDMARANLLRPKSTALWASNDIDELHEQMSNQLQHLVTHSMSLDGNAMGTFAPFLGAEDSINSDATDSAEANSAEPQPFGHLLSPQEVPQSFGRGHGGGGHGGGGHGGGRHHYSRSVGDIVVATGGTVHGAVHGTVYGVETPKNLLSPQTADQWDDAALDHQAEEMRMQLEQYRME